ncbi:MAG: heparinase II/III family protein [Pirellulales bacterium]|nr:heparinase II/III family protein [Pirellulales bacterium]
MTPGEIYTTMHIPNAKIENIRACLALALLLVAAATARADSPQMLFCRSQIPELRERITQPEFAPIWRRILNNAEAYCDPKSPRYADPADPYPLPKKGKYINQRRHNALLVHRVGGTLTKRMEAIGVAYQLTGRQELGRHGAALLLATVKKYPITNPLVSRGFAGGRGDVMRGLAMGYDLLSDQLDDEQRTVVASACTEYLDFFVAEFNNPKSWWYKVHNYNGVNGGSAGCLALALSDAYPDRVDGWLAECKKIIDRWLTTGFDEEGAYFEGVGYSGYGLSNTVLFADALLRSGRGNLFDHPTFRKLGDYYALSMLPGERVYDARNDSSYRGSNVTVLKLAAACHNGLYKWLWEETGADNSFLRILWDNDVAPLDPPAAGVPNARHFRGRGLCVWRTGWTDRDVMFSIEAGPYHPVTHNQADKGHFTLYGLGHRWAVDPGYANEHEPKGRGQTIGHSCLLIDGKGQALSGAGWGTNGAITEYSNNDRYGYALADCTEAYNRNNRGDPGTVVERAKRHAFFVYPRNDAPAYAVVMDDIRKDDQPHDFTWQMMVPKQTIVTFDGQRATFEPIDTSGDGYVDTPFDLAQGGGYCVLDFEITEPGEYVLWARVRTQDDAPGQADSFFVRMDDGRRIDWHMPWSKNWTWRKVGAGVVRDPVSYELATGKHKLTLQMREPGAQVDCLLLTRDREAAPAFADAGEDPLFVEAEAGRLYGAMRLVRTESAKPRLVVHVDAESKPTLSTDVFEPEDYHGPAEFPRFRATVRDVEPRFFAVLLPLPAGVEEPKVKFESVAGKRLARIRWPGHTDVFEWSAKDATAKLLDLP